MFLIILHAFRTCSVPKLHELFDAAELTVTTVLNRTVPKQLINHNVETFNFTPVSNRTVLKRKSSKRQWS